MGGVPSTSVTREGHQVILTVIQGSDEEDSDEEDDIVYVPQLRTVTRNGRIAGTWQRNFSLADEHESEEDGSDCDSDIQDGHDNDMESDNCESDKCNSDDDMDSASSEDDGHTENIEALNEPEPEKDYVITQSGRKSVKNPKYKY